ncbi:hypothetical protein J2802_002502 [Paraburkholderia caribensis]|nr:hypothetical protein [Paraburkholderia caribensis]
MSSLGDRHIAPVQPPRFPDGLCLDYIGLSLDRRLQVKTPKTADAFWSAEQILRADTCGALFPWAQHAQASSLRWLHLAAQSSETLFTMVRPLASAQDSSPALLRLALRPPAEGLMVDVVKRRGPTRAEPLSIPLQSTLGLFSRHASLSRQPLAEVAT